VNPLGPARPDLVFRSTTQTRVGDIKYKLFDGWGDMRADLYQSVFFAAAYETYQSVILGFTTDRLPLLDEVQVGKHKVRGVLWRASEDIDPRDAAADVIEQFRIWIAKKTMSDERTFVALQTSLLAGT
jgi:hypothetical protein